MIYTFDRSYAAQWDDNIRTLRWKRWGYSEEQGTSESFINRWNDWALCNDAPGSLFVNDDDNTTESHRKVGSEQKIESRRAD